jgi:hypothetical protein
VSAEPAHSAIAPGCRQNSRASWSDMNGCSSHVDSLDQAEQQIPPFSVADSLTQLRRDGVALVSGHMPEPVVLDMLDGIPPLEEFENVSAPGAGDALVFLGADRIQCLSPFFHDSRLRQVARAYIGSEATAARRMIEMRWQGSPEPAFGQPPLAAASHHQLNFVLYLCDVGESDWPLICRGRSHTSVRRLPDRWESDSRHAASATNLASSTRSSLTPDGVGKALAKQELPTLTCYGQKGLLVIYDAAGLERIIPRGTGIQTVLVDSWTKKV